MEISSNSSQPANHLVQKAIDETVIIKEAEIIRTEPEENFTVKYNYIEEPKNEKEKEKEKDNKLNKSQNIIETTSEIKIAPKNIDIKEKDKDKKEEKKEENEKESYDYEIDILSDSSSLKKNNNTNNKQESENVIDVSEDKNSTESKDEEKNDKEESSKEPKKDKFISGYCPFNFFEKEKCKNINFKEVNIREYVSALSSLWKKMSDKEKEPYIKLSEEYKQNLITNNISSSSSQESEEQKMLTRKRRRRRRRRRFERNNSNDEETKENKALNNQMDITDKSKGIKGEYCTTVYTTNKYIKKKMMESNYYMREKPTSVNKISYDLSQSSEEKENKIEENKVEENKKEENKLILIKDDSIDKFNEFLNSTLIPFVVKSFDFLKTISDNDSK